jgi:hypothetical protein
VSGDTPLEDISALRDLFPSVDIQGKKNIGIWLKIKVGCHE